MTDLKDFLNQTARGINTLVQSPFYQDAIEQQQKSAFQKDLNAYNEKKFNLTCKEIDSLILSIGSGKNTYKDIQDIIPSMNSPTMCSYLWDDPKVGPDQFKIYNVIGPAVPTPTYFQFKEVPDDFFYLYEFKPTDTFILNITGENRLYELQKEQYIEKLPLQNTQIAKESLTVAKESATYAKKAYYAAIIIGIIGILLGIQEKLISLIQSIFY